MDIGNQDIVKTAECITEGDKAALDVARMKQEVALANAKAALAQSEVAKVSYDNIILQLAVKYKMSHGDKIEENGQITRTSSVGVK